MNVPAPMTERHAALLARFAEQAASLAEDLCAAGLAAETLPEKQAATAAFHRAGRALRLAIALEAKLRRDQDRAALEGRAEVIDLEKARAEKRKTQVKAAVERLIWSETEDDDDELHLRGELDELLDIETQDEETFLAEPLDHQIARLCEVIGIAAPSPLAGEGGPRKGSEEGSHGDPDSPAQPLIRPADAAHLLPQGEKDASEDEDPLLSDDDWKSSA